jgi:uncharacterized phiE125 gp8 family phage protein
MITPSFSVVEKGGSPVEVEVFKSEIKRDQADTYDDARLSNMLEAATEIIQHHCDRALMTQTLCYVLPDRYMCEGPDGIELPRPPLQKINAITCVDTDTGAETTLDSDIYYIDPYSEPGRLVLVNGASWSDLGGAFFRICYDAGYGDDSKDVPDDLIRAVIMLATHLYVHGMNFDTKLMPPELSFLVGPYVVMRA